MNNNSFTIKNKAFSNAESCEKLYVNLNRFLTLSAEIDKKYKLLNNWKIRKKRPHHFLVTQSYVINVLIILLAY